MEKAKLYAEDLFESAPVAYVVLGEDFEIVRFNALFKATFSPTAFEVLKDVDFRRLIAADDLSVVGQKLFDMYQTFHNHAEAKGFGFFMVKHQLEAMGGRMEVRSKGGEGTRFELYIPGCLDGSTETE